jgi:hypothetical protein
VPLLVDRVELTSEPENAPDQAHKPSVTLAPGARNGFPEVVDAGLGPELPPFLWRVEERVIARRDPSERTNLILVLETSMVSARTKGTYRVPARRLIHALNGSKEISTSLPGGHSPVSPGTGAPPGAC